MNVKKKIYNLGIIYWAITALLLLMIGMFVVINNFKEDVQYYELKSEITTRNESHKPEWMEVFLGGKKVGYFANITMPFEAGHKIDEEIFLKLNAQGNQSAVHIVTRSVVDQNFLLKDFKFSMTSGAVTFISSGKVVGSQMILEIGEGETRWNERIMLSSPPMISSGIELFFRGRGINVGEIFKFSIFDPSTMTQNGIVIRAAAKETIIINNQEFNSLRLETEMWGHGLKLWLDENGNLLKETGFMGLTLIRCDEDRARQGVVFSDDFYEIAAINVKKGLPNHEIMTCLKLKISGLSEKQFDKDIINEGRQRLRDGILEISQEKIPVTGMYVLPYNDITGKLGVYLRPELSIESNNRAIIQTASEIMGDNRDPFSVAEKLMEWVYKNVKKIPVISVPSAAEVLRSRVGDCNEHAVLLTALLRSSGIPARLCVGLVFSRGKFYYHAWTEGYFGRWISMDSTLNQMPVDVTHIKLYQGGLDSHLRILEFIGKLKIEVIEYRYN